MNLRTLERAALVRNVDLESREVAHGRTFLSYLHMCVADRAPTAEDYATTEPIFDAELRGSGWLVVPVKEPAGWSGGDAGRLVDGLVEPR